MPVVIVGQVIPTRKVADLPTPALVVDAEALEHNIEVMRAALPGARLRPHVKAHKCTSLARRQAEAGHHGFTCATIRECEGMVAAGLGQDLMLANEVLDAGRIGALVESGARVTLAVDSAQTVDAAVRGGVREVIIDVNVGLPRCGCPPDRAGELADLAREGGLEVRGVMGYEGHVMIVEDGAERAGQCRQSMELLVAAAADVGGELISAGGTGTYDCNTWATEIQAGSYALMDAQYGRQGHPFRQAAFVLASVISSAPEWSVADAGLKAFGMDHGNPELPGSVVWFCSDEHTTFSPPTRVGDRVWLVPAHVDPTIAYHQQMYVFSGEDVVETWPIDLRWW
jgi:D-serine deaminase-like pyridoxal phosphate-dependent protein